jgi:glycosyltransferase involved in cell wall biosynthesis
MADDFLMRLLYLGSTDFPQPKARAIQIVNTCHALARAGAEVTLVVGRRGRRRPQRALAAYGLAPHPRLRLVSVPILRIPPSAPPRVLRQFTRLWQASYLVGLAAVLPRELLARRPDVVYARDLRTARLAAGPTRAIGARLGFEVHGLPSFEVRHGAGRASLPASAADRLRRLESDVFARADHIVTITECARQILLEDYAVPPARVRTIPDGTAGDWSSPHPNPLPEGEGTSPPSPAVYYVGQLYPWKGAGLVVEAAALVRRARFVVVGGMPNGRAGDADVAELAARARKVGAADRVELRGYVPYGRVRDELAGAAVALLPLPDEPVARYFTSPLKLFDYMAAGVPIVASDLPSLREVLRDGDNALLVAPGDAAAAAGAIDRLLADPALARRLASQALLDVRAYTWDARAARLLEFLKGTPSPPGRGRSCVGR